MGGFVLLKFGKIAAVAAVVLVWFVMISNIVVVIGGRLGYTGVSSSDRAVFFWIVDAAASNISYAGIVSAIMIMAFFVLDYLEKEMRSPYRRLLAEIATDAADRIVAAAKKEEATGG